MGAMPKCFQSDSLVIEEGRNPDGWEVLKVPWPEEDGDFSEICEVSTCNNKKLAVQEARKRRREEGGCWYVRPVIQ